ncbi:hypothetical protein BCV70DRAFT_205453 [Testicularia cyperi]|uniref:Uncharacterized protein n=1 Tax=Testicularia cyperi TaxID=1882483 RepID=A0A317XUK4_9BASI|nr:hypothetical protein BCV70DRAFT_205453 [Testicularia cyperi]
MMMGSFTRFGLATQLLLVLLTATVTVLKAAPVPGAELDITDTLEKLYISTEDTVRSLREQLHLHNIGGRPSTPDTPIRPNLPDLPLMWDSPPLPGHRAPPVAPPPSPETGAKRDS